jgi:hypothetical protein
VPKWHWEPIIQLSRSYTRELKIWLAESFGPTWCPAYSKFWYFEFLGYLLIKGFWGFAVQAPSGLKMVLLCLKKRVVRFILGWNFLNKTSNLNIGSCMLAWLALESHHKFLEIASTTIGFTTKYLPSIYWPNYAWNWIIHQPWRKYRHNATNYYF